MIILTADQADAVRGETSPGHALEPIVLADGVTYFLPETVLTDPWQAPKHDILATLPTRVIADSEYVQPASQEVGA